MDDRRRFFDLLPFYVNGTLSENDLVWFRDYMRRTPELRSQVEFQQAVGESLKQRVEASVRDVPTDLGLDGVMARIRVDRRAVRQSSWQRFLRWLLGSDPAGPWRLAPALVLALAVIGVQGLLLMQRQPPSYAEVRSPAPALADGPLLRVNFKPDARETDIRLKLVEVRALIVAGPTRLGDYYLKTAPTRLAVVKQALDRSGLTQAVDEVPGLPEEILE
jgi:hypothetical protein